MRHLRHLLAREEQEAGRPGLSSTRLAARTLAPFGAIGVLAAGAALLGVSLCPFATLTGLPCPGCGILRALVALAEGHVRESVHLHPLALCAALVVSSGGFLLRPGARRSRAVEIGFALAGTSLLLAMMAVWIARFGGALGGPVPVNSLWSALDTPSPVAAYLFGDGAERARH